MARPPIMPAEKKAQLVLDILAGTLSVAQAARQAEVSEQAVGNWKRQFLAAGRQGLEGVERKNTDQERRLLAEVAELKTALGEVYVQLRARRGAVGHQVVPSGPSRPYGVVAGSVFRGSAALLESPEARTRGGA